MGFEILCVFHHAPKMARLIVVAVFSLDVGGFFAFLNFFAEILFFCK